MDSREENERLRQENQQLKAKMAQSKKGSNTSCLIIGLIVAGFAGITMFAILAAISLPMYTRFKQKATASKPIKIMMARSGELANYYGDNGTFDSFEAPIFEAGLVPIQEMTWQVRHANDRVEVRWDFGDSTMCPATKCNGTFCIQCGPDGCYTAVRFDTPELMLDNNPNNLPCPG